MFWTMYTIHYGVIFRCNFAKWYQLNLAVQTYLPDWVRHIGLISVKSSCANLPDISNWYQLYQTVCKPTRHTEVILVKSTNTIDWVWHQCLPVQHLIRSYLSVWHQLCFLQCDKSYSMSPTVISVTSRKPFILSKTFMTYHILQRWYL